MTTDIVFPVKAGTEYASFMNGRTFARLFYQFNPTLSAIKLDNLCSAFRINEYKTDRLSYTVGFKQEYRRQGGNRLPLTLQAKNEEKQLMGKLTNAQTEANQLNGFVKPAELAQSGATFCINGIRRMSGNFGDQWALDVEVPAWVVGSDEDGPVLRTVTFGMGTKGPNSRDRLFETLLKNKDFPVHYAVVKEVPMSSGGMYYELAEDETQDCACGAPAEAPEQAVKQAAPKPTNGKKVSVKPTRPQTMLGDLDDRPF